MLSIELMSLRKELYKVGLAMLDSLVQPNERNIHRISFVIALILGQRYPALHGAYFPGY